MAEFGEEQAVGVGADFGWDAAGFDSAGFDSAWIDDGAFEHN